MGVRNWEFLHLPVLDSFLPSYGPQALGQHSQQLRSLPSARLECLELRIQQYTFEVQHTSAPSNPSDYLSRHLVNCKEKFRRMEFVAE